MPPHLKNTPIYSTENTNPSNLFRSQMMTEASLLPLTTTPKALLICMTLTSAPWPHMTLCSPHTCRVVGCMKEKIACLQFSRWNSVQAAMPRCISSHVQYTDFVEDISHLCHIVWDIVDANATGGSGHKQKTPVQGSCTACHLRP